MNVLMTADPVGGVWTYSLDLARALGEEGVRVTLATMGGLPSASQREEAQRIDSLTLYSSEYRLPWMDDPWDDVRAAGDWLQTVATRVAPDLVHLNEPVHGSLKWNVPVVAVGHSCVLSWWNAVLGAPAPPSWNRYRDAMVRGLSQADAVVAPSQWMLQQLRRYYGVRMGRVIPNGREPNAIDTSGKAPLVFAAGRVWDPAKNLMVLDEVAGGLAWPVYVAGEPRDPDGQTALQARHVQLLGKLSGSEVGSWLQRATIYAFPARYEPFGLSVLEAALASCALVLGDLPTLREQWDGRAVFVPPDDPATLQLALEWLIENPDLRTALAMRAQRHALTLTARGMALRYLRLYSELIARPQHSSEVPACAS
jgi:glycogen(starch) synthase